MNKIIDVHPLATTIRVDLADAIIEASDVPSAAPLEMLLSAFDWRAVGRRTTWERSNRWRPYGSWYVPEDLKGYSRDDPRYRRRFSWRSE